jgi:hypothetical protein
MNTKFFDKELSSSSVVIFKCILYLHIEDIDGKLQKWFKYCRSVNNIDYI